MKALITGGSGFVGGHLFELLKATFQDCEVRILDTAVPMGFRFEGKLFLEDIRNDFAVLRAAYGADVIFHIAGVLGTTESFANPYLISSINISGALRAFDAARELDIPVVNLSLGNPWANPYMITKRTAHEFAQMYNVAYGTKITTLTGRNAYGPRQKWGHVQKVAPTFVTQALKNEPLRIWGDGEQIIDLIYIRDMVRGCILAAEKEIPDVIDLGTGIGTRVKDFAETIIKMTDSKSSIQYLPMRKGEPFHSVTLADTKKAEELLGFKPEFDLEKGLGLTIEWYKKHLEDPLWAKVS